MFSSFDEKQLVVTIFLYLLVGLFFVTLWRKSLRLQVITEASPIRVKKCHWSLMSLLGLFIVYFVFPVIVYYIVRNFLFKGVDVASITKTLVYMFISILCFCIVYRFISKDVKQWVWNNRLPSVSLNLKKECILVVKVFILSFCAYTLVALLIEYCFRLYPFTEEQRQLLSNKQQLVYQVFDKKIASTWRLVLIFIIVVIVPIIEEFLFRGGVQNYFRQYLSKAPAILLTALIFTFFHVEWGKGFFNLQLGGIIFVLGIFLGYLYEYRKILLAPILLHMLFNGMNTLLLEFFT